ncbi:uncharacterized protein [Narcine bancroftii]|uniref:uncharacterized protein n=1 Tax=Narcine bancroftii TaxID=1343680 RepID=UPI003831B12F
MRKPSAPETLREACLALSILLNSHEPVSSRPQPVWVPQPLSPSLDHCRGHCQTLLNPLGFLQQIAVHRRAGGTQQASQHPEEGKGGRRLSPSPGMLKVRQTAESFVVISCIWCSLCGLLYIRGTGSKLGGSSNTDVRRCLKKAANIIKNSHHPCHNLSSLLLSSQKVQKPEDQQEQLSNSYQALNLPLVPLIRDAIKGRSAHYADWPAELLQELAVH